MNQEYEFELINILNLLLNNKIDKQIIKIYITQAYNEACGICNLIDMPLESVTSVAFLALSSFKSENSEIIQSLSEGGRSVTFGNMTSEQLRQKALKGLEKWKRVKSV